MVRGLMVSALVSFATATALWAQTLTSTNLPLVLIYCGEAINAQAKVQATMKIIYHQDGELNSPTDTPTDYDGRVGIKLRGNSSLSFAQKKYTIETQDADGNDLKTPLLGMPAESDWVLLAPYNDISLLRDVFAFQLWTDMGHWAPRTRLCEVLVNDEYQGVYVLSEKIKRDKERVDKSKVKGVPESQGGGFGGWPWGGGGQSTAVTWTIYHPKKEKLQPQQKAYIQDFVDRMEQSFQAQNWKDPVEGYARYVDVPSFVDYFIHTELSLNADGFKRSAYFYKDKDAADGTEAKMVAGPVWDYNLAYGDCNFCNANNVRAWVYEGCTTNPTPAFWKRLTTDPAFMQQVRERYAQLRHTLLSQERINSFFDTHAELLSEAKDRHYQKYSDLLVDNSQQQQGGGGGWPSVKEWFQKRLAFLDSQWGYDDATSGQRALRGDAGFDIDVETLPADPQQLRLVVSADRPLRRVEVCSLSGQQLVAAELRDGQRHMARRCSLVCSRQPCVVVCQATDGSRASRTLLQR